MLNLFQRFADAPANCAHPFFGLPTWYTYLPSQDFKDINVNNGNTTTAIPCQIYQFHYPDDLAYVALAAVDIALVIAGMVAVFFIIYGGIQYVISQGEPDKTRAAKNTITNALIGLVVSGAAYSIVSFLGSQLGG